MNESGITSQYGFLFQRKVFVLYVLENMNVKQRFCFEGKDDVEIAADEKIYELDSSESNCVQVKSGQVNQSCFSKVVGNWLLLDSVKPERYTLFIENELKFDLSLENVINEMLVFVEKGKSKKKTSIAYKVYEQYKDDLENDDAQKLKDDIKNIIDKIKIDKCSIDELDLRLETIFFEKYCTDIVEYNIAKRKRLEKFIQDINKQIDESIKQKKAYSLVFFAFAAELVIGGVALFFMLKKYGKVNQSDIITTSYTYEFEQAEEKKLSWNALLKSPTFWVSAVICLVSACLMLTQVTVS